MKVRSLLALLLVKMNGGMNLCQDFKPVIEGHKPAIKPENY